MENELTLVAALTAGLVGSAHCLGMCGGIAGALGMSARQTGGTNLGAVAYTVLFNLGRVLGYGLIGGLVGLIGQGIGTGLDVPFWSVTARTLTGVVMILIGLQIATRWRPLAFIERGGARLWSRIGRLAQRLIPARRPHHALAVGMLWGWLPCGLVYSILLMALVVANPVGSALLMMAFGVGTLPSMTATGLASSHFNPSARPGLRRAGGVLLVVFGLWTAALPLSRMLGGDGHQHGHHTAVAEKSSPAAIVVSRPVDAEASSLSPQTSDG